MACFERACLRDLLPHFWRNARVSRRDRHSGALADCCIIGEIMSFAFTLYDALVSIDVPAEKARAVIDALEHDMGSTLATKQDVLLLKQEMDHLKEHVTHDLEHLNERVERNLELLRSSMTVRLGSIQVVAAGLLFAALKLT
jgi:hypothetical protein